VSSPDPWLVLGVAPGSSLAEARLARRRLAKTLHPDIHGDQADLSAQMTSVNRAVTAVESYWEHGLGAAPVDSGTPVPSRARESADEVDSFSIEWLPVEAFEILFLAAYGLGDILVADEPYLLDLYLNDPACFCRLTLAPEAGGSLITVDVSSAADSTSAPPPGEVIDVLVAEVDALLGG
jgi:hypothetical protein